MLNQIATHNILPHSRHSLVPRHTPPLPYIVQEEGDIHYSCTGKGIALLSKSLGFREPGDEAKGRESSCIMLGERAGRLTQSEDKRGGSHDYRARV